MSEEARAEMRHEAEVIPLHGDRPSRGSEPPGELEQKIAGALRFVRHRLSGEYQVDEFGFDPELNDRMLMPLARQLYERWFRAEMLGLENVPDEGPALVVGNHSGTLPL